MSNMADNFASEYRQLLGNGIVDTAYPVDGLLVQLPNGWHGIHEVLKGFSARLGNYGYTLEMIPSICTPDTYANLPPEISEGVVDKAFPVTHTGFTKLDIPYLMGARPDLIVPQIEKLTARSYKNLPVRRICDGFRYFKMDAPEYYPLITDLEQSAIDAVGIFYSEEEFEAEIAKLLGDFEAIARDLLRISTFTVKHARGVSVYTTIPNGTVLEIVKVRNFGRSLSEAISFTVLGPDNRQAAPFIFDFHIDSRTFAASVVAHANGTNVVLPSALTRSHAVSFGVDCSAFTTVRVDKLSGQYSDERFAKLKMQGVVFALLPAENGVLVKGDDLEQVVPQENLEGFLAEILERRDAQLTEKEKALFQERMSAVQIIESEAPVEKSLGVLIEGGVTTNKQVVAQTLI